MTLLRLQVLLQYLLCLCHLMSKLLWAGCFSLVCRLKGRAFLQSPRCRASVGEWDSGYDSLRRRMSVLERLTQTHQVWLLLAVSEDEASGILLKQPPGVRGQHQAWLFHRYQGGFNGLWCFLSWSRCFWSGRFCRGRFCPCVWIRISQKIPSATSMSERVSTVSRFSLLH